MGESTRRVDDVADSQFGSVARAGQRKTRRTPLPAHALAIDVLLKSGFGAQRFRARRSSESRDLGIDT